MGVRIDKAWQRDTAAKIQFFRGGRFRKCFDLRARSNGRDQPITNEERPVFDDAEVGKRGAATGVASAQRQKL